MSAISTGARVREARKTTGLSQIEVAELADLSRRTVQRVELGKPGIKVSSVQAIAEVLNLDLRDEAVPPGEASVSNLASFSYLPFRMFRFVSSQVSPSELAFCDCEKEFLDILEILWSNFQYGLANFCPIKTSRLLGLHPCFCSKKGYFERYLGIWRSNPKSFSFSSANGRRSGVSIVLPVAESTYNEFLAGRRSSFGIEGPELMEESSTVIFEALSLFSTSKDDPHSLGESLAFVATNHLSHVMPYVRTHSCDIASFGVHAENIKKMQRVGLKPTGTQMPILELPIWHASNRAYFGMNEDEEIRSSTFRHFLSLRQKTHSLRAKLSFESIAAIQANRLAGDSTNCKKVA